MSDQNDGGPAFPSDSACESWQCRKPSSGMTLRDWFAGQALVGIMSRQDGGDLHTYHELKIGSCGDNCITSPRAIAAHCYTVADMMLEERGAK